MWLCDACGLSNRSKSTNASIVSGPRGDRDDRNDLFGGTAVDGETEELSWGAVFARLDKLEGKVQALWEENASLRAELAQCQTLRSDVKALEYRLDAMTFWGVTPGRPSDFGQSKPLAGGSLMTYGLGDLSGPYSASSPVVSKRVSAAPGILYRDILSGGLGSPRLGRPMPGVSAVSSVGGMLPGSGGSVMVASATGTRVSTTIVSGPSGLGLGSSGSSGSDLVLAPVPFVSPPNLETIAEVSGSAPVPGPSTVADRSVTSAADGLGTVPNVRDVARSEGGPDHIVRGDREEGRRVHRSENKKRPLIVGSSASCPFSAVPIRGAIADGRSDPALAQVFVTRLALDVTPERIRNYLLSLGYSSTVIKLKPPQRITTVTYSSFKVTIPRESLKNLLSPDIWPPGAGVKEWFFRAPNTSRN